MDISANIYFYYFFEPVEAKFNIEQAKKFQRRSKCTGLPVDLKNKVRACLF